MTDDLARLLHATRAALLEGNLAALTPLAQEIGTALADGGAPPADPVALHALAQDNARLLEAALRGVKAVRRRIDAIAASRELVTYDAAGQRGALAPSAGLPARRV